jgi:DNA-binding PadR family transcriptional regulator
MVDRFILEELRRTPLHGRAVTNALARRGLRFARSAVHAALRRFERDGLVVGSWQDGRRRRVYRLTHAGDEALRLRRLEVRSWGRR